MFIKIDKTEKKVFPYTLEQLQAIFHSPLFLGCQAEDKEYKPGNILVRDHRFWLPLVCLFSGARQGEICQLLTTDIQQLHGHWVLNITSEDDSSKHLKTKGSKRIVPIHPTLMELGLLELHKRMEAKKEKWLFPEIQADSRGNRAGRFSDFYGDYIRHIGVKTDKKVNFHSFRHSFADALRNGGYLDNQFAFLIGHTQNNVTGRYGTVQEGDIAMRVRLVLSVAYPGLDLSSLKSKPAEWPAAGSVDTILRNL